MCLTAGTPAFSRDKKAKRAKAASELDDELAYQAFMVLE